MPLTLDTSKVLTKEIVNYEITSFKVDIDNPRVEIEFKAAASDGEILDTGSIRVRDADAMAVIAEVNTVAGVDAYTAIKTVLYSVIKDKMGVTGSVV